MRVLVTGPTGRIGRVLLGRIPESIEAEVLLGPRDPEVGHPWYRSNISDHDRVVMAITCASPDTVIHLAAATDVDGCESDPETAFRVNRDGTANIAEACAKCGAAMVYVSTDYVFDGISGPYSETDAPNPVNVYGRSKLEGERAAAERTDRLAIVRISVPIGTRMEGAAHNFISLMEERLSVGETVRVVTDQRTTPAWLDELAEFLWAVVLRGDRGIIHYGSSDRLSRYEMARELCQIRGYDEGLALPVRTGDLRLRAMRPLESGFVTERAADILGRKPLTFREGLRRMAGKGGEAG